MSKVFSKLLSNKKIQICVALLLICIIVLIVIKAKTNASSTDTKINSESKSIENYECEIENRINEIVGSMAGVSNVKSLVYTNESIEIVYAYDEDIDGDEDTGIATSKALTFQKNGSTTEPVVIKRVYPKIIGILVVAKGVDNERTRISIINALASVFDIEITSIEVLIGE